MVALVLAIVVLGIVGIVRPLLDVQGHHVRRRAFDALSSAGIRLDAARSEVNASGMDAPLARALDMVVVELACERTAASCIVALVSGTLDDWSAVDDELVRAFGGDLALRRSFQLAVSETLRCAALTVVARHAADVGHPQRQDAERVLRELDWHPPAKVVHFLREHLGRRRFLVPVQDTVGIPGGLPVLAAG